MSDELRKLLEQLQKEIELVDDKGGEFLHNLNANLQKVLDRSEEGSAESEPSVMQQLEDSIERFEETYPTLTLTLSKVLEVLKNAGI